MNAKTKLRLALIPLALAGSATLYGSPEIHFKDLPALVQQTIDRYKENGEVKHIEQQTYNGAIVYDVRIKRLGPNRELHVTESGAVLENDPNFVAQPGSLQGRKLQLSDLPEAVQNTVRAQAGSASIDDIDQATVDDRVIYEIEFQRGGKNQEAHIASDGALIQGSTAPVGRAGSEPGASLPGSSRQITVNDLPAAARRIVEREAAGAPIEDIGQTLKNGKTFYEVTFKRSGQNVELAVAPDGSLIDQNGNPIISAAQPSPTGPSAVSQVIDGDRRITFAELPLAVMRTVQSEVGSGRIDTIDRKVRRERPLYQVAYSKDGQGRELVVAETGGVIKGSSSAEATANQNAQPVSLSNARKVTFSELPAPVRNIVRAQAGTAPIEDIDKGIMNGRTVYQAAFKKNGQHTELMVAEDGTLVGPVATETATPQP